MATDPINDDLARAGGLALILHTPILAAQDGRRGILSPTALSAIRDFGHIIPFAEHIVIKSAHSRDWHTAQPGRCTPSKVTPINASKIVQCFV